MRYVTRRPGPPLAAFVDHFWSLSDAPPHGREHVVPSGTIELVVNLDQDEFRIFDAGGGPEARRRFSGAIVSGCYSRPFGIDTRDHAAIVGVHFKPGGASGLLGAPPGELSNLHVALEDLWGARAAELRERLCAARTTPERFRILEHALIGRLPGRPLAPGAVATAVRELARRGAAVGDVAARLRFSRRHFIEVFTRDVGLTPKRYARVRRFQRALSIATTSPASTWAQIALECGYCDQAHLCREWAELAGLSPAELVALRATPVKTNHVALPAERSHSSKTAPARRA
jgi:AraC-like DNA-binding protein